MARRALGSAGLEVTAAVDEVLDKLWFPPGGRLVVGVSGGADSLALAGALAWCLASRERRGERTQLPEVLGVVVDHGLQEGSARVAARAAEQVRGLGLTAEIASVAVSGDGGPEAAARQARLQALRAAARGGMVMLAHSLDDQAETVLLGLARGSGARSLAAMAPVAGDLVRPLLGLRRSVLAEACHEWGLAPWQDPHNDEPRFARVRVRHRVLPVLEDELGPGVAEALARTATLARADADALEAWAARVAPECELGEALDCRALQQHPRAIASRVVRSWLVAQGADQPTATHVASVLALVTDWSGQGPVHLSRVTVGRHGHLLHAE